MAKLQYPNYNINKSLDDVSITSAHTTANNNIQMLFSGVPINVNVQITVLRYGTHSLGKKPPYLW